MYFMPDLLTREPNINPDLPLAPDSEFDQTQEKNIEVKPESSEARSAEPKPVPENKAVGSTEGTTKITQSTTPGGEGITHGSTVVMDKEQQEQTHRKLLGQFLNSEARDIISEADMGSDANALQDMLINQGDSSPDTPKK
jgi:hypothetical protein